MQTSLIYTGKSMVGINKIGHFLALCSSHQCLKHFKRCIHLLSYLATLFQVGWYNDRVAEVFKLPYSYNTAAVVLLSVPEMFDLSFIPFLKTKHWIKGSDPLDQSIAHFVSQLKQVSMFQAIYKRKICLINKPDWVCL